MFARSVLLATLLPGIAGPNPAASPPTRVAVLSIALKDLANQPATAELPGRLPTPELGAKLAERGGAWMADQVSQAIEHAAGGAAAEARRCSPKAS